jgi:hypothetical protein
MVSLLKAEGEPSWVDSYRWFIFGSWANLLLLLVPVAVVAHHCNWDAPLRFGFSFVAIIPLAKVRVPGPSDLLPRLCVINDAVLLSCLAMRRKRCRCPSGRPLLVC